MCSSRKSKYSSLWLVLPLGPPGSLTLSPPLVPLVYRAFRDECLDSPPPSVPKFRLFALLKSSPSSEEPPEAVRLCALAL